MISGHCLEGWGWLTGWEEVGRVCIRAGWLTVTGYSIPCLRLAAAALGCGCCVRYSDKMTGREEGGGRSSSSYSEYEEEQ
jgi:hypothetical protein